MKCSPSLSVPHLRRKSETFSSSPQRTTPTLKSELIKRTAGSEQRKLQQLISSKLADMADSRKPHRRHQTIPWKSNNYVRKLRVSWTLWPPLHVRHRPGKTTDVDGNEAFRDLATPQPRPPRPSTTRARLSLLVPQQVWGSSQEMPVAMLLGKLSGQRRLATAYVTSNYYLSVM